MYADDATTQQNQKVKKVQMDTQKSIEDKFSKIHPCFPVNTRIVIVGAGPSGISAAYALCSLGYNNVTVIEKHHSVGGMCESVDIEGKIYDLGGQVLAANSAPTIFHLAKETGSELVELDSHKLALIDSQTGNYQDNKVADDYVSVISLTLELQDKTKDSGRIGVHAVSDIASDITPAFLERRGFKSIPKSVAYGYTASGYGFVQDMPYAYIHEFTRTSMAGKIRRFRDGYTSLWKKVSESLPITVMTQTEVLSVRRNSRYVEIDVKNSCDDLESMKFDKVILSGAFPFRNGRTYRSLYNSVTSDRENNVLELSELEKELFSKVQTIDYYTTVLKIKGLEHLPVGFYYFEEFMTDPETIGNPVAMQRFYSDTDVFLFWSYGNSANVEYSTVLQLAVDAVKRIGAEVEMVVLQRRFKYFPHVNSQDMKDGFYDKIENQLQGQNNTYYVGGLMAFELTERNSSYSMALISKHFANTDPQPGFPYVKRLFTLLSDCSDKNLEALKESQQVEFPELSSLDGYLKHWGTHNVTSKKTLYKWIGEDGQVVNERTYEEQNANASCIARKLLSSRKPIMKQGDRVLLVYVPGLDFIDAFFGCLRAGVLPVPVLPSDPMQRGGQALLKIENIAKSCNAVAILSTAGYHAAVRAGSVKILLTLNRKNGTSSARWPNLPWIHTDSWVKNAKETHSNSNDDMFEPQPSDLCFLQFTSGSTGDAKGVMITHGGLIHNVKLMRRVYKSTSSTVLISWLPQYHDMGLIGGLFTALVSGGSAILFSPMTFIRNPLMWLETMSKYKATHSAGPNFAFELVVRRLEANKEKERKYDLSSLKFLMIAAEPVRQKTLKSFIELTRPFGLSQRVMAPGYGLAENCVFVSCAYGEGRPILVDWQGRVGCGYTNQNEADVDIKIVDPESGEEHEEPGKEGEIWISSPSAGVGYWGREELTEKTFRNKLGSCPEKLYTRTGDLGRIIEGNLFITGRIKDLIIVAGRNIYPSDIEKTVESSSEVLRPGCCAVIGVPEETLSSKGVPVPDHSDQVGLVVIAEVRDGKPVSKDVTEEIKARVAEEHGVTLASVKLIKPRTISKTTSGKIKRFECLKQYVDGTLDVVPDQISSKRKLLRSFTTGSCKEGNTPRPHLNTKSLSPTPRLNKNEIIEFLKGLVSEQTGISISKITTTESLVSYGIDSIGVVRAAQKLSDFLGVQVGAIDIFTATCIEDLAKFTEDLVLKSRPHDAANPSYLPDYSDDDSCNLVAEEVSLSPSHRFGIMLLQLLALVYAVFILVLPAYSSISVFKNLILTSPTLTTSFPWARYAISLVFAPFAWLLCITSTCISIGTLGNLVLQPNYSLTPEVSIWSFDFVKWWALYKAQEISSNVMAVHLRGTVFLKYWFQVFGARIGSSVILDTVDITDPALVSIGDGAVIAEGALVQGHEVKNGILSFLPVRIGKNCSIGPYAVLQKGSVLAEGTEVASLQKTAASKSSSSKKVVEQPKETEGGLSRAIYHLFGIYIVGFISALSGAILYFLYILLARKSPSLEHFSLICLSGAFHWLPFTIIAYMIVISTTPSSPIIFSISVSTAYLSHGLILSFLTIFANSFLLSQNKENAHDSLRMWLKHRINVACHLRFAKLLSGTEAFCVYLRLLGAKVGKHCSIRAINAVSDPRLMSLGDGVHLGDFSRIITGFYSSSGFTSGVVEVQDNSVVGSQSVVLPRSLIQKDVILGALSVAPMNSVLQSGGIYVGSQAPVMIKNTRHAIDERIEEMDMKYKKIVGNLAANLAATTLKVKTRYFHRIGVSGKGILKIYDNIKGFPDHKIFRCGKQYPVIVRHSNSLSADDDARLDARGAALRILSDDENPILDLTLKTGEAFYARTISDFATWLVCGLAAREEHVKRVPHIRDAVWGSLRDSNSYTEMHYYSNICRLFRFTDGQEMYVKFKLRPYDENISQDSGKVEPIGILPPETGAIPRKDNDTRPLLFLVDDFKKRVTSQGGVRYIFQLQFRPVPEDEATQEIALDCTIPWDESEFPHIDIGEILIDQNHTEQQSEQLEFNPFLRSHEIDVVKATSASQSASIDHGRSLIYEICQHLRNGEPLPESWKNFIYQSDVKLDLSTCPVSSSPPLLLNQETNNQETTLALSRTWYQTFWSTFAQPILQTFLPYFLLSYSIHTPLNFLISSSSNHPLYFIFPFFWISSGLLSALSCVLAKLLLTKNKKHGGESLIWSKTLLIETLWQAHRTLVSDYFMEMTKGSFLFVIWMKLMGSEVQESVYVDTNGVLLNPEMIEIERGGCIGKEALLFGHVYEGDHGVVKFGKVRVCEGSFVGSRAVAMPGVVVESGCCLNALSLAMKEEVVKSR